MGDILDHGLSFISGRAEENRVRFWVESRTRIFDSVTGRSDCFYQCASCKSEHTFAERNLFVEDNTAVTPYIMWGGDAGGFQFSSTLWGHGAGRNWLFVKSAARRGARRRPLRCCACSPAPAPAGASVGRLTHRSSGRHHPRQRRQMQGTYLIVTRGVTGYNH